MSRRRRLLTAGATLTALSGLLISGAGQAGAAPDYQNYVALGDSYASGPFIPSQSLNPIGCARSDHNYAGDLARDLGVANFTDVTCGGADSTNMTNPQSVPLGGTNAPQFNALTPSTDLVTITIGGNDIGFTDILETCAKDSLSNPLGDPCEKQYTAGGTDQLAAKISADAGQVAGVLAGIRQRSPQAKVVVVGYLRILPPTGGCWPSMPVAVGDVPYLNSVEDELNGMLAQQAQAAGDTFVDPSTTPGHDSCTPEGTRWVEPIVPSTAAFPAHPNADGMTAVEGMVRTALG
jgi:lysophospholipase L1-like esterase